MYLSEFFESYERLNLQAKRHGFFLVLLESTNLGSAVFVKVNKWLEPGLYSVIGQTIQMGKFIVVEGLTVRVTGTGVYWNSYLDADARLRKLSLAQTQTAESRDSED